MVETHVETLVVAPCFDSTVGCPQGSAFEQGFPDFAPELALLGGGGLNLYVKLERHQELGHLHVELR